MTTIGTREITDPNAGVPGARRAWARIVAAWPERDVVEPGLAAIAAADIERVLSGIPASALDRAVSRYVGGEVGDPRFPPKVGEVAAEARRICSDDATKARAAMAARNPARLPAPPVSADEQAQRARIAAMARAAAQGWKSRDAAPTPARYAPEVGAGMTRDDGARASAVWHLERARELGAAPLPVASPDLLKAIRSICESGAA